MKHKLLKSALLGAAAVGVLGAGVQSAHADALIFFDFDGTHADNDKITIPCEATDYLAGKDYNLDNDVLSPLGHPTGVTIKYETNYGNLTEGDQIRFKLHNAVFGNLQKCWLVFYEDNDGGFAGVDTDQDGRGEESHDVNGDGDHADMIVVAESIGPITGQSEIFLRVTNNGVSYPSNGILFLACAEPDEPPLADQDNDGATKAKYDKKYNPVIRLADLYDRNEHNNICPNKIPKPNKEVCLTVRANACCPNTDLELPDLAVSTPQCLMDVVCQFALNMKPTLSIIDMYTRLDPHFSACTDNDGIFNCYDPNYVPGTMFVNVNSDNDILTSTSCTDNDAADGTITIQNDPNNLIDDYIKLGGSGNWKAKFNMTLYDVRVGANGAGLSGYACDNDTQYDAVKPYPALDFAHNRLFLDNNGSETSAGAVANRILFKAGKVCTFDNDNVNIVDSGSASSTTIVVPHGSTWTDDVYMGITKKDRLYWVKWGLQEVLKLYDNDNTLRFTVSLDDSAKCSGWSTCCYENDGNSHYFKKWEPNGTEAYIPHLLNTSLTYVKIANNSCWDAEVYARVWDEDGDFVDNVYLGKVPAHGGKVFWGNQIFSKAKALNPKIGGGYGTFSAILTIGGPKRDIEVAVGDSRPGKGKMLPVYDDPFHDTTNFRNKSFTTDYEQ